MATYSLINGGTIIETGPTTFPVAAPLAWTSDISTIMPQPAVGWAASQTGGPWSFTAPPAPPAPTLAQQAAALLSGGLVVTSAGAPALNGTYAATPDMQLKLMAELMSWQVNGKFTNGSTIKAWPTMGTAMATIASQAQLQEVLTAVGAFVDGCETVIGGASTILPSNTVAVV